MSSSAERETNQEEFFRPVCTDGEDGSDVTEIESLCVNCGDNVCEK